jgi:hypothetical protein
MLLKTMGTAPISNSPRCTRLGDAADRVDVDRPGDRAVPPDSPRDFHVAAMCVGIHHINRPN